ncbi:MAG: single-stranded-DNA-specific exonuclease RecJ [Patescibacteria group bacterium]
MKGYSMRSHEEKSSYEALLGYPELIQNLLFGRGVHSADAIERFLNPDYERDVYDPFLLKGMDTAIARIVEAIEKSESVALFSDFDADGIPAAVVMSDAFAKLGHTHISVTIPHRNTEGFGLNEDAVTKFINEKVSLVITLDCGMGDAVHVKRLMDAGIAVIVTDHHLPNHAVPEATAIVNPNQTGDTYPNKHLCGSGVAYKVVQALFSHIQTSKLPNFETNKPPAGWEKWLLDMVAIATLSDMVALTGENRALVTYGLLVLRKSPRVGLRTLLKHLRIKQHALTEDDVVFMITPRINAASRMDEPELAFRLLSTRDVTEAQTLVEHLDGINNERKGAVAHMSKEIKEKMEGKTPSPVLVVGNPHWRPGLLGLAATRAVEVYGRPTFVWGRGDAAVIKGSCRSDGSVDVNVLMNEVKEYFLEFGGHAKSGGFSTTVEHIVNLEQALSDAYVRVKNGMVKEETTVCDAELTISDVNGTTSRMIQKLAPFGMGNDKPIFVLPTVRVNAVSWFGKAKEHIRLTLADEKGNVAQAIQFFAKENQTFVDLNIGTVVTVLGNLEQSDFGRTREVRIRIVDVVKI